MAECRRIDRKEYSRKVRTRAVLLHRAVAVAVVMGEGGRRRCEEQFHLILRGPLQFASFGAVNMSKCINKATDTDLGACRLVFFSFLLLYLLLCLASPHGPRGTTGVLHGSPRTSK
jgi:hypothetical protein